MDLVGIIVGYIGAVCIGIFSAPGLFRVIRTKDTYSVSLTMFLILSLGSLGFVLQQIIGMSTGKIEVAQGLPVMIANLLTLSFALSIITIKLVNIKCARALRLTEKEWCIKKLAQAKIYHKEKDRRKRAEVEARRKRKQATKAKKGR